MLSQHGIACAILLLLYACSSASGVLTSNVITTYTGLVFRNAHLGVACNGKIAIYHANGMARLPFAMICTNTLDDASRLLLQQCIDQDTELKQSELQLRKSGLVVYNGETVTIACAALRTLAKIAYGEVCMGDAPETVKQKMKADKTVSAYEQYTSYNGAVNVGHGKANIGTSTYRFDTFFHMQKLYKISFYGYKCDSDYYDGIVRNEWENLCDIINKKYGHQDGDFPAFYALKNGYVIPSHCWVCDTKRIVLGAVTPKNWTGI